MNQNKCAQLSSKTENRRGEEVRALDYAYGEQLGNLGLWEARETERESWGIE